MASTFTAILKPEKYVAHTAVILYACTFLYMNAAYASYSVTGNIYAYASGGGPLIDRDADADPHTSLTDYGVSNGSSGSVAKAKYFANLATGWLGTYVYGYSPKANTYEGGAASAASLVSFNDTISLTIPAGDYASDLYVTLHGFLNGHLVASGGIGDLESNVAQVGNFRIGSGLGGDEFVFPVTRVHSSDGELTISESFELSAPILRGGLTLTTPQTVTVLVNASIKGSGSALSTYPYGSEITSMLSDFYSTGGFTAFDIPEGVTWTSDSGVFLSQAPIPLPPSFVLFSFGLLSLMRFRKK